VLGVVNDNRTLKTPLESAECGPLTLLNGTTYIMTGIACFIEIYLTSPI